LLVLGVSADAANLTKVRIGTHPDKTRVVLETDGASVHRITSSTSSEIVIRLDADSVPEAIAGDGKPLLWVRIEPRVDGTDVRLQLARSVGTKEMVLESPDRIVLDLIPGGAPVVAVAPAPIPAPIPVEPEPEPVAVAPEPEVVEPVEVADPQPAAGFFDLEPGSDSGTVADAAIEPEPEVPAASDPPSADVVETPRPSSSPPPARGGGTMGVLGNPVVLGAAGLVLALFLFWAIRRRGSAADSVDEEESDGFPPDPADETTGSIGAAFAQSEAAEPEPAAETAEADAAAGSIFDVNEAEVVSTDDTDDYPAIPGVAAVSAVAEAPLDTSELGDEMAAVVKELERRMAHFETRLEEVVDAKERLERQVSAQTEELRVQRAAIARTQRVLRGISRPEDEASEPAPK
jgi:hypothetical protein